MNIIGADLHPGQVEVIRALHSQAKYITCVAPRQVGKSFLGQQVVLDWALNNPGWRVFWIAPTYNQARKPFEELLDNMLRSGVIKQANKSELNIKFINGSEIYFKSVERPDNLRGFTAHAMLCDEAAYYQDDVWKSVLKPMTLVNGQKVLFISTPRGKSGYFYEMYQLGKSGNSEYAAVRMHYSQNPFIDISEIEEAKRTLPEHIFKAEYEGSFVDSGSTVFTNIEAHTFAQWPKQGTRFYAGIDVARSSDFTVCTILNDRGQVVDIYRDNKKEWPEIIQGVVNILKKWNAKALLEVNGVGDVVFSQIKQQYRDIEPFITTGTSKQQIIEQLVIAFNQNNLWIPSKELFPHLAFELEIFEYRYNSKSRSIQYSHPDGFNDDCVLSLAMAYEALNKLKTSGMYATSSVRLR